MLLFLKAHFGGIFRSSLNASVFLKTLFFLLVLHTNLEFASIGKQYNFLRVDILDTDFSI